MKHKHVDMDACLFLKVTHPQDSITTRGVSSCLCLMFYGHQSDKKPFIGMYHWSGFANPHQDHGYNNDDAVHDLVYFLSKKARDQLNIKKREPLYMDKIFIVGGEKYQNGSSSLSGTEQEVKALNTYFLHHCHHFFKITASMTLNTTHFLTSGEQYLDITMAANQEPTWTIEDPAETIPNAVDTSSGNSYHKPC